MGKIEKLCPVCGKYFIPFGDHKSRKQKYCDRDCWAKRNPPEIKRCLFCNKIFKTYVKEQKYCSFECKNKGAIGRILSEKTKEKMSKAKQGYMPVNIFQKGEKHPLVI